jgi:hypothetical protein
MRECRECRKGKRRCWMILELPPSRCHDRHAFTVFR